MPEDKVHGAMAVLGRQLVADTANRLNFEPMRRQTLPQVMDMNAQTSGVGVDPLSA
jgi:hypothetical protein